MMKHVRRRGGRRWLVWASLLTIGALAAAGGLYLHWVQLQKEVETAQAAAAESSQLLEARLAEIEAKKKEPVYMTLPGAETIEVRREHYTDADSIWVLVNKDRGIPLEYVPSPLITPTVPIRSNATSDERLVRGDIVQPLADMFAGARQDGHNLMIGSAYRSSGVQTNLFNTYVAQAGLEQASMYSARPGHSEHQLGLAVDISTESQQCYLSECFTSTPDGEWLAANAYKYGFTLRYPKGKEAITGYNFEPWHYRYVGIPLATALYQSGLTLEEAWPYMETAQQTLVDNRVFQ